MKKSILILTVAVVSLISSCSNKQEKLELTPHQKFMMICEEETRYIDLGYDEAKRDSVLKAKFGEQAIKDYHIQEIEVKRQSDSIMKVMFK